MSLKDTWGCSRSLLVMRRADDSCRMWINWGAAAPMEVGVGRGSARRRLCVKVFIVRGGLCALVGV